MVKFEVFRQCQSNDSWLAVKDIPRCHAPYFSAKTVDEIGGAIFSGFDAIQGRSGWPTTDGGRTLTRQMKRVAEHADIGHRDFEMIH